MKSTLRIWIVHLLYLVILLVQSQSDAYWTPFGHGRFLGPSTLPRRDHVAVGVRASTRDTYEGRLSSAGETPDADIIIIGGGLVGTALGVALTNRPWPGRANGIHGLFDQVDTIA